MRTASGLIGACIQRCAPCQESLAAKLLDDEDPIALAVTAASVYNLHVAHEPDAGSPAAKSIRFFLFVKHVRLHGGDAHLLPVMVERMSRSDRAALLDDALKLWTHYEPEYLGPSARPAGLAGLHRHQGCGCRATRC
ncbi:hypothetical protein [Streptomyces cavernae]|uniref:hypothetical protein n=1 Tax=Streptomyces cavernae TaxID=2259034 RepID=UPI000FEBA436|nr:hypothetical protein [Streptomyces cavernae]